MEFATSWNFNVRYINGGWAMVRGDASMPHCSNNEEAYRAAARIAGVNRARGPQQ